MTGARHAVIFGTGSFAKVAHFYLTHDSGYEVVGFTEARDGPGPASFLGLPVVPFAKIESRFPPGDVEMFVAVGYSRMNALRERFMGEASARGYRLLSYVCSKATHWGDTAIGANVFVFEANVIQPFVSIGDGTILWSGNHIGHDSAIGPYCFLSSHIVVSGHCRIGSHCFIGVNSSIGDGTVIGDRNIIGPGTLVQKDTGAGEVYLAERTKKHPKDSSRFLR